MDLIFTKSETGKSWVAEFEATADFNLHIERRDKGGDIWLYQRTNGGGWDIVNDFGNPRYGVIDYDCTALIYPKYIKVVSEVEPTYAAVTSAGEVTEIKAQDKSVEITANGTTTVEPDAGFAYLNKVSVKTNVAQSGEGGGSTGGGGDMSYMDVSSLSVEEKSVFVAFAFAVKMEGMIAPSFAACISGTEISMAAIGSVTALAVDLQFPINIVGNETTIEMALSKEMWDMLPRITEAEFYNLNA